MGSSCSVEKYFDNSCSVNTVFKMVNSYSEIFSNMKEQIQNINNPNYLLHKVKVGKIFYKYDSKTSISVIDYKTDEVKNRISFSIEQFIALGIYSEVASEMVSEFITVNRISFSPRILDLLITKAYELKKEVKSQEHTRIQHRIQKIFMILINVGSSDSNYVMASRVLGDFPTRGIFTEIFTEILSEPESCPNCRDKTLKILFGGLPYSSLSKLHLGIWLSDSSPLQCGENDDVYGCLKNYSGGITVVNR